MAKIVRASLARQNILPILSQRLQVTLAYNTNSMYGGCRTSGIYTHFKSTKMVSVVNTVDTAHEDMIHDAQMDYYGTHLATCSSDRTVKVFEVKNNTQRLLATLQGHEGPVWQIAWAHPMYGNILASCSYDRKVIVWREQSGQWSKIYEYSEHDSSVNSVCWAPYEVGLVLACGSSDGAISILTCNDGTWDTRKISNAHSVGCNAVSWAPAVVPGSLVEPPSNTHKSSRVKKIVSGGCDNLVKIWCEKDGQEWEEEATLESHDNWVRDVAWAPSIGLPKSKIASCCQEGQVIIWTNGDHSNKWTSNLLNKFDDVVWHVSWSLTGDILAVSGGDNKVTLWKEGLDGKWDCISDVSKTQNGQSSNE